MLDLREDIPEEEVVEQDLPGQTDENITTLDENGEALNRHELELSLIQEFIDQITVIGIGGLIPVKGIIAFSGVEKDIPENWQLCNGQRGTPDLRDTFIMGSTMDDVGKTGGSADIDQTLPEHTHRLDHHFHDIPGHTHTLSNHTHSIGNHSHSFTGGSHSHSVNSHSHSMAHNHGGSTGATIIKAPIESLVWYNKAYSWYTTIGFEAGNNLVNAVTEYNGSTTMTKIDFGAHSHSIPTHSGNTGAAGSSTSSAASGGTVGSGGEGTTGNPSKDKTGDSGTKQTETAGAGDTFPAGSDESGTGKNIPPYMKLAYIQRIE